MSRGNEGRQDEGKEYRGKRRERSDLEVEGREVVRKEKGRVIERAEEGWK